VDGIEGQVGPDLFKIVAVGGLHADRQGDNPDDVAAVTAEGGEAEGSGAAAETPGGGDRVALGDIKLTGADRAFDQLAMSPIQTRSRSSRDLTTGTPSSAERTFWRPGR
jgi:hypothetical protein